jgi:hypothetical protein
MDSDVSETCAARGWTKGVGGFNLLLPSRRETASRMYNDHGHLDLCADVWAETLSLSAMCEGTYLYFFLSFFLSFFLFANYYYYYYYLVIHAPLDQLARLYLPIMPGAGIFGGLLMGGIDGS